MKVIAKLEFASVLIHMQEGFPTAMRETEIVISLLERQLRRQEIKFQERQREEGCRDLNYRYGNELYLCTLRRMTTLHS